MRFILIPGLSAIIRDDSSRLYQGVGILRVYLSDKIYHYAYEKKCRRSSVFLMEGRFHSFFPLYIFIFERDSIGSHFAREDDYLVLSTARTIYPSASGIRRIRNLISSFSALSGRICSRTREYIFFSKYSCITDDLISLYSIHSVFINVREGIMRSGKYLSFEILACCLLLHLGLTAVVNSQTFEIGGIQYSNESGAWYLDDGSGKYLVDTLSLTIKLENDADMPEIREYLEGAQTKIIRVNSLGYIDIQLNENQRFDAQLTSFINHTKIQSAEMNTIGSWATTYPPPRYPNDTYRTSQWYLDQSTNIDIDACEGWGYSYGAPSVIAAVLDNGIEWTHEDIGNGTDNYDNLYHNPGENDWTNPSNPASGNGVDDDGNGFIDDWKGWNFHTATNNSIGTSTHGTRIAGIIGAKSQNNKGISGIAGGWNNSGIDLLSVVVGGSSGPSSALVDDGIIYAVNRGAKVINMSFLCSQSAAIDNALEFAYNNGCVLVASAGNKSGENYPCAAVWYPARHQRVIAVSGIMKTGQAYPSCEGPEVSIAAPAGSQNANDPVDYNILHSMRKCNGGFEGLARGFVV